MSADLHEHTIPKGLVQLEWYRRGRYFGINFGTGEADRFAQARVSLADLLRLGQITRTEAAAALDEINAPKEVAHIDQAQSPDFVAMRVAALPEDCTGRSVLDIGGYDVEIAAECLARGATSAIVFDSGEWSDYSWVKPIVKDGCVYQRGDLMNFGAVAPKPADIVLLYNVIYHLRDPWTALERCRLLTKETFVICTSFVEGDEPRWELRGRNDGNIAINDTHTVFWKPTISGLRRLLEVTGFTIDKQEGPVGDHVCFRCH